MPINALIFDLGDVIIDLDYEATKREFKKLGATNVEAVYDQKNQSTLFDQFELGLISAAEFRRQLKAQLNLEEVSDQQFDLAWNAQLLTIDPRKITFLQNIPAHYQTFLFSNTNEIHYKKIVEIYRFQFQPTVPLEQVKLFDGCFKQQYYSFTLHMKKPDTNAFLRILSKHSLDAATTLFIDDNPGHLAGAHQAGLHSYLYKKGVSFDHIRAHVHELDRLESLRPFSGESTMALRPRM